MRESMGQSTTMTNYTVHHIRRKLGNDGMESHVKNFTDEKDVVSILVTVTGSKMMRSLIRSTESIVWTLVCERVKESVH